MSKDKKDEKKKDEPISLAGPDFKELMAAFLKVDPKGVDMDKDPCKELWKEWQLARNAAYKLSLERGEDPRQETDDSDIRVARKKRDDLEKKYRDCIAEKD